jgi:hypothetical protein
VSLTSLLWSLLSAFKVALSRGSEISLFSVILNTGLSLTQFIRCLTAFVRACLAIADTGGRYRSASAVVVLLLSALPYAIEPRVFRVSRAISALGGFLAFITLAMMIAVRVKNQNDYYAKLFLSSPSSCAIAVKYANDPRYGCPHTYFVGCGLDNATLLGAQYYIPQQNPNTFENRNRLALGETILGLLLFAPFILLGAGFTLYVLACAVYFFSLAAIWVYESFADPFVVDWEDEEDEDALKNKKVVGWLAVLVQCHA